MDYNRKKYLSDICSTGSLELVEECIRRRRESSKLSQDEIDKALFTACKRGFLPIIKVLLKEGGDILSYQSCSKCGKYDYYSSFPLKIAAERGDRIIFELLLEGGDSTMDFEDIISYILDDDEYEGEENYIELLYEKGYLNDLGESELNKYFMISCRKGYLQGVKIFSKLGANIFGHRRDFGGGKVYPIILACENGHKEIVYELISLGADLSCIEEIRDNPKIKSEMEGYIQDMKEEY